MLLTELISATHKGHRGQNGFKPQVQIEIKTKLKAVNRNIESRKLKNKYSDYLKKWQTWKALMDNSGFRIDEET